MRCGTRRFFVGVSLLGVGGIVWLSLASGEPELRQASEERRAVIETAPIASSSQDSEAGLNLTRSLPKSAPQPQPLPGDRDARQLHGFAYLNAKALLQPHEAQGQQRFLASEDSLNAALRILQGRQDTVSERRLRLVAIDYLNQAADWHENPQRSEVLDSIEALLLRVPQLQRIESVGLRRSLIGDSIELSWVLARHRPEVWQEMRQEGPKRLRRLLAYAQQAALTSVD